MHPNKHIRAAIEYAQSRGWRFKKAGPRAHAWGRLYCPHGQRGGGMKSVWGTPQSPEQHARALRRAVDNCSHYNL